MICISHTPTEAFGDAPGARMAQRIGTTNYFGLKSTEKKKRGKMYHSNSIRAPLSCLEHGWAHHNLACPSCLNRSAQPQKEFSFKDGDIAVLKASRDLLIKKCETLESQLQAEKKRNLSLLKTLQQFLNIWAENYLDRSPEE